MSQQECSPLAWLQLSALARSGLSCVRGAGRDGGCEF